MCIKLGFNGEFFLKIGYNIPGISNYNILKFYHFLTGRFFAKQRNVRNSGQYSKFRDDVFSTWNSHYSFNCILFYLTKCAITFSVEWYHKRNHGVIFKPCRCLFVINLPSAKQRQKPFSMVTSRRHSNVTGSRMELKDTTMSWD